MFFHLMGANALPPFVWTGNGGDTNWSTAGNWSSNVVPGISDVAIFMGPAACNVSCAATVDVDISVLGINMQSTFTGTITQAATKTMIIGASGWTQSAGTFIGSDANITINNIFTLSGGVFTSTSAQLLVTSGFNYTAGTFNHNNGLLRFDNNGIVAADSVISVSLPGAVQLWNLQYSGGYAASSATYSVSLASGSFDVQNQFQIGLTTVGATGAIIAMNGTINLKGNLVVDPSVATHAGLFITQLVLDGTGAQTYSATGGRVPHFEINKASGTVTPTGGTTSLVVQSFTLTSGSFTAPPSTLTCLSDFLIASGATYTYNNGSLNFDRYSSGSPSYTISLPSALTVNNLSFGGGVSGASNITSWGIVGSVPTINVLGDLSIGNTRGGTGVVDVYFGEIFLSGNYLANTYSGSGSTVLTFTGTGTQRFMKTGAGSTLGGTITVDKTAGALTLFSAASFSTAGQDLSVTAGTMNMGGNNLTINDVLTVGVLGKLICNGGVLSAASYVINGEISCGPTVGITWTGLAGDNLWTTAGNWTNNTIPGASDIAVFNGVCSGANCNVTMNAVVNVKGIKILSSYTGTITQAAGITVTIGTSGWVQEGGTFAGGSSTITMNGLFSLSGGAFTSTSATMFVNTTFTVSGSPTFTHNSGTLQFSVTSTVTPGTVDYYNVNFAGGNRTITISGTMTVNATLTLVDTYSGYGSINSGTIEAYGNVNFSDRGTGGSVLIKIIGTANQTVTGTSVASIPNIEIVKTGGTVTFSGILFVRGNYTYTSGTVDTGTSTLFFAETGKTITPGAIAYNNVTFAGANDTMTLVGEMTVNGTLTLADTSGSFGAINTGTVLAYGNVNFSSDGKGGSALIKIVGSGNQTITGVSTAGIPPFEIASTGGTVTLTGTFYLRSHYTYTSGTVDASASTLLFSETGKTITPGAVAYNNVTFAGSNDTMTLVGDITVNGTLTFSDTSGSYGALNSGTVLAYGDVFFSSNGKGGTSLIKIVGSGNQTITGISTALISNFEIASTGGTVTFSGTLFFNKNYTYTSGTIDAGTSTMFFSAGTVTNVITPGALNIYNNVNFTGNKTSFTLANDITVNGVLTIGDSSATTGSINTGAIFAYGNIAFISYGKYGTSVLNIAGTSSTTFTSVSTAKHTSQSIVVNKTGGSTVTMLSDVVFNVAGQDLTLTSGTFDLGGFDLTVVDVLTVGAGTTLKCSGGDFTPGSLTNNGTINCPGYNGYDFNWTGAAADSNWATAGNWSGGAAPLSTAIAVFDDAFCGVNCNATMNAAVNIKGIQMNSGYTGTITQAGGVTLTVGASNWVQAGGTFTGGDSAITVSGSMTLSGGNFTKGSGYLEVMASTGYVQTGGTFDGSTGSGHFSRMNISSGTFTAPNGTLQLGHNYTYSNTDGFVVTGGTFNHGSGTIELMNSYASNGNDRYMVINVPAGGLTLNHLVVNFLDTNVPYSNGYGEITTGDTLTVAGDLTLKNGRLMNGTILLNGNLDIQCAGGNYSTSDVCADGGSTLVRFNGSTAHTYAFASGAMGPYIDIPTGETVTPTGGTTLAHFGKFNLTGGTFTAPSGTMQVGNDYYYSYTDGFIVTGGTYNHSNGNVEFMNSFTSAGSDRYMVIDVPVGGFQFYNLTVSYRDTTTPFNEGYGEISAGDTLTVLNTLTLANGRLMGGTLDVYGDLNIQCAGGNYLTSDVCAGGGTTNVRLLGAATQTITHASGGLPPQGLWAIDKSGGSVVLNSNLNLSGTNQDLTITNGTLNMSGYDLTVNRDISNNGVLQRGVNPLCGTITSVGYLGNSAICP